MRRAIILFLLMVVAQWLLPIITIVDQQRILKEGTAFHFRTAPIDPHDPFRGEYVILRFAMEDSSFVHDPEDPFEHGERVAVLLAEVNEEAIVQRIQREAPDGRTSWLWAKVISYAYMDRAVFNIDLPFGRYYLEEGTGRRTEDLVYAGDEDEEVRTHAVVRAWKGKAAIEDLLVDGRPVREIILEERLRSE